MASEQSLHSNQKQTQCSVGLTEACAYPRAGGAELSSLDRLTRLAAPAGDGGVADRCAARAASLRRQCPDSELCTHRRPAALPAAAFGAAAAVAAAGPRRRASGEAAAASQWLSLGQTINVHFAERGLHSAVVLAHLKMRVLMVTAATACGVITAKILFQVGC